MTGQTVRPPKLEPCNSCLAFNCDLYNALDTSSSKMGRDNYRLEKTMVKLFGHPMQKHLAICFAMYLSLLTWLGSIKSK